MALVFNFKDNVMKMTKWMILLVLAAAGCKNATPPFQISTEPPMLVQSPIVLAPNSIANRLVSFAQEGGQLVLATQETTFAEKRLHVWWHNVQTGQLDQKVTFLFPMDKDILDQAIDDVILSTQDKNTLLVFSSASNTMHRCDASTRKVVQSTKINPPSDAQPLSPAYLRLASDSLLIGFYYDQKELPTLWVTDAAGTQSFSHHLTQAYSLPPLSQWVLSPDQKVLFLLDTFSNPPKIKRFEVKTGLPEMPEIALPDSIRNVKSIHPLPNSHVILVTPKNFDSQYEYVELDENFQLVQSTSISLPFFSHPPTKKHQETLAQTIMDATNQTLAFQTTSGSVLLWDATNQAIKTTTINMFRTPLKAAAPVGEKGMVVINVPTDPNDSTSHVSYWEWPQNLPLQHMHAKIDVPASQIGQHPFVTTKTSTALLLDSSVLFHAAENNGSAPLISDLFPTLQRVSALASTIIEQETTWWGMGSNVSNSSLYIAPKNPFGHDTTIPSYAFDIMSIAPSNSCIAGAQQKDTSAKKANNEVTIVCTKKLTKPQYYEYIIGWELKATWSDLTSTVEHLLWSPGGEWVFGSDSAGNAVIWAAFTNTSLQQQLLQNQSPVVGAIWLTSDVIAFVQQDGTLTLQSALDASILHQQQLGQEFVQASFAPTEAGAVAILLSKDRFSIQRIHITK